MSDTMCVLTRYSLTKDDELCDPQVWVFSTQEKAQRASVIIHEQAGRTSPLVWDKSNYHDGIACESGGLQYELATVSVDMLETELGVHTKL